MHDGFPTREAPLLEDRLAVIAQDTHRAWNARSLTLNLSGVSSLVFDNSSTAPGDNWIFELDSITFIAAQVDLSLALDLRGITLGVLETATRDVNGRLFRLRMRSDESDPAESPAGKDIVNVGADGKQSVSAKQAEPSRLQFFAQGDFSTTDQHSSDNISGFGGQTEAGTVGLEYALSREIILGVAVGYVHNYTNLNNYTDTVNIDGLVASTYASWFIDNFYLDGLYSFSYLENDLRSSAGNQVATAQPATFGNTLELNAGYNFVRPWVVTGPIASLNYTHGDIDDFSDSNGASVQSQNFNSLISQLGWQASFPRTTHQGMLTRVTPQLHAAWAHEYMNNSESVSANYNGFTTTGYTPQPERDYATVGAGIMAEFGKDFSVTLDYQIDVGTLQVTNFVSARGEIKF